MKDRLGATSPALLKPAHVAQRREVAVVPVGPLARAFDRVRLLPATVWGVLGEPRRQRSDALVQGLDETRRSPARVAACSSHNRANDDRSEQVSCYRGGAPFRYPLALL